MIRAKPTRIVLNHSDIRCRSIIEAKWGLFLDKAVDTEYVEFEPKGYSAQYGWRPDFYIRTRRNCVLLAEVKPLGKWRRSQFNGAMRILRDGHKVHGILLITFGGEVTLYTREYRPYRYTIQWEQLETAFRRDGSCARLADPTHHRAGEALREVDFSSWYLFPWNAPKWEDSYVPH